MILTIIILIFSVITASIASIYYIDDPKTALDSWKVPNGNALSMFKFYFRDGIVKIAPNSSPLMHLFLFKLEDGEDGPEYMPNGAENGEQIPDSTFAAVLPRTDQGLEVAVNLCDYLQLYCEGKLTRADLKKVAHYIFLIGSNDWDSMVHHN